MLGRLVPIAAAVQGARAVARLAGFVAGNKKPNPVLLRAQEKLRIYPGSVQPDGPV